MDDLGCRLHLNLDIGLLQKAQTFAASKNTSLAKLMRTWISEVASIHIQFNEYQIPSKTVSYNLQINAETNRKLERFSKSLNVGKNNIIKLIIQHHLREHLPTGNRRALSADLLQNGDTETLSTFNHDKNMPTPELLSILISKLFHEKPIEPPSLEINNLYESIKRATFNAEHVELISLIKAVLSQQEMRLQEAHTHLLNSVSIGKQRKSSFYLYAEYYMGINCILKGHLLQAKELFLSIWKSYPSNSFLFERSIFLYRLCTSYLEGDIELGDMIYKYNDCAQKLHLLESSRNFNPGKRSALLFGEQTQQTLATIQTHLAGVSTKDENHTYSVSNPVLSLHSRIYKILSQQSQHEDKLDYLKIIEDLLELKTSGYLPDVIDYYIGYVLFKHGDKRQESKGQVLLKNLAQYSKLKLVRNKANVTLHEKVLLFI